MAADRSSFSSSPAPHVHAHAEKAQAEVVTHRPDDVIAVVDECKQATESPISIAKEVPPPKQAWPDTKESAVKPHPEVTSHDAEGEEDPAERRQRFQASRSRWMQRTTPGAMPTPKPNTERPFGEPSTSSTPKSVIS